MILARSPYIVHFDDSGLEDIEYKIYIYTGTKTTDRVLRHTIARDAIDGEVTFDVAPLIRDYLVFAHTESSRVVWVGHEVAKDTGAGLGSFADVEAEQLAFYGFTDPEDGENDDAGSSGKVFMQSSPYFIKPTTDAFMPISLTKRASLTPEVEFFTEEDGGGLSISTTSALSADINESDDQYMTTTIPSNARSVRYNYNSVPISNRNIKVIDEVATNTPLRVTFINRYGLRDFIWFFANARDTFSMDQSEYKRSIMSGGTYTAAKHSKVVYNKTAKQTREINSGWYPEAFNQTFKELLLSEEVWFLNESSEVIPVIIRTNSITYKTAIMDRMINYAITIELTHESVNNIS